MNRYITLVNTRSIYIIKSVSHCWLEVRLDGKRKQIVTIPKGKAPILMQNSTKNWRNI